MKVGDELPFTFMALGLGACGLTLLYQSLVFLRYGVWEGISLLDALRWLHIGWAKGGLDWVGVYLVLDFIPLSLVLLMVGIVCAVWTTKIQ